MLLAVVGLAACGPGVRDSAAEGTNGGTGIALDGGTVSASSSAADPVDDAPGADESGGVGSDVAQEPPPWNPVACDDTPAVLEVFHAQGPRGAMTLDGGWAAPPVACGTLELGLFEVDPGSPPRRHEFAIVREAPAHAIYDGSYDSIGLGASYEGPDAIEFLVPWDPRTAEDPEAKVPLEVHIEIEHENLSLSVDAILPFCADEGHCYCPCE